MRNWCPHCRGHIHCADSTLYYCSGNGVSKTKKKMETKSRQHAKRPHGTSQPSAPFLRPRGGGRKLASVLSVVSSVKNKAKGSDGIYRKIISGYLKLKPFLDNPPALKIRMKLGWGLVGAAPANW
jgi:hypothetical protein